MKCFSDDDLKRLKELVRASNGIYIDDRNVTDEIKALLSRLEATEKALEAMIELDDEHYPNEPILPSSEVGLILQAWRKTKGE